MIKWLSIMRYCVECGRQIIYQATLDPADDNACWKCGGTANLAGAESRVDHYGEDTAFARDLIEGRRMADGYD